MWLRLDHLEQLLLSRLAALAAGGLLLHDPYANPLLLRHFVGDGSLLTGRDGLDAVSRRGLRRLVVEDAEVVSEDVTLVNGFGLRRSIEAEGSRMQLRLRRGELGLSHVSALLLHQFLYCKRPLSVRHTLQIVLVLSFWRA